MELHRPTPVTDQRQAPEHIALAPPIQRTPMAAKPWRGLSLLGWMFRAESGPPDVDGPARGAGQRRRFVLLALSLAPAFYAMRDTWTPMTTGMVAVGVNIAASLILMWSLGAVGLALATAVASASNCLQLVLRLRRRIGLLGGRVMLRAAGRVALACIPMAAWGIGAQVWWSVMAAPSLLERIALLVLQLAVAVVLFVGAALSFRCEEFAWARDLLRRRARRGTQPDRG